MPTSSGSSNPVPMGRDAQVARLELQDLRRLLQEAFSRQEAHFNQELQKRELFWMKEALETNRELRQLRQQVQELQQVIFSKDLCPSTVARRGPGSLLSDSADSQFNSLVQLVEQVCRHMGNVNENNNSVDMDPLFIWDAINALQLWNGVLSFQLVTTAITKSVRLSWSNDLRTCHLPFSAIEAVDSLPCPEVLLARSKYSQSTTTTTTTTTTTSEASSSGALLHSVFT